MPWLVLVCLGLAGWTEWAAPAIDRPPLRIPDSDAPGQMRALSIDDARLTEGDSGQKNLVFVVHLSVPANDWVSVIVSTVDGTATGPDSDYVPLNLVLKFAPYSTAESLAVSVSGDRRVEGDEWFRARLSNPNRAVLARAEGVGSIMNDDLPVLSVTDTSLAEGGSGRHPMAFRVRLTPPAIAPVPIHFETQDGTATAADGDYLPVSGDTLLAVGQDQIVIEVPVAGDSLLEGNERFSFHLVPAESTGMADASGIGTLLNDEGTSFVRLGTSVRPFLSGTLPPAWGDLNGDDRPDLPLYLNSGGEFIEMPNIRGLLGNGNYHGAAWCDYDRDGDMDLVVMPYGGPESSYNHTHLFENTPGGLQEVGPAAGVDIMGHGETPSWADFNADGWPDLFLPFYSHVAPFRSYFYVNLGGGIYHECAESAGVALPNLPIQARPEGVGVADWNGDGTLDLYCASHLFLNDGNAHFTDIRAQTGLPMMFDEGAQFVDFDNDGDLDLYLRTYRGPTLFRNNQGSFADVSALLGTGLVDWDWGDRWADFDNDGDLDLLYFSPGAVAHLLLNVGDDTFREDTGFLGILGGSSLSSIADIEGDGDLDIAMGASGKEFGSNLLERIPRAHNPCLRVRVTDNDGRCVEHGATIRLRSLDDPRHPVQTRIVDGGSGYLGQDEYTVTFGGVGSGSYDLEVSFPTTPAVSGIVGPVQNPLLGGIRPGEMGPKVVEVRPNGQVTMTTLSALLPELSVLSTPAAALWPAAPNPTHGATRFNFSLPGGGSYTLAVYDLNGRRVRTLAQSGRSSEHADAAWDLRDDDGARVPAGLYFAQLSGDRHPRVVQRVVVLR